MKDFFKTATQRDNSRAIAGSMKLRKLRVATLITDYRQRTTVWAVAGITKSRIYGITKNWLRQTTRQLDNETTSGAAATCSLVVL